MKTDLSTTHHTSMSYNAVSAETHEYSSRSDENYEKVAKKTMRKTLFWLLIFLGVMVTFRCCKGGRTVMVLRRGDSYIDQVEVIKNEFCFLFRIKIDCDIYNVFGHRDTYDVLIFKDGRLEYIGNDVNGRVVCGKFLEKDSGRVYRINHRQYMNPLTHARLLVGRLGESKGHICVPPAVEGGGAHKYDWWLTSALIIGKTFGWLAGGKTRPHNSLTSMLGFDYGRISIDARKKDVIGSLGHPVYVDTESGVEYYGRFEFLDNENQLIGIAYSNGVVNAVFSDKMLDPRIIYKCTGLDYMESERETSDSFVSCPD